MLTKLKEDWKKRIEDELKAYLGTDEIAPLTMGVPPKKEMGDIAFPMFPYSKSAKKAPAEIVKDIGKRLEENHPEGKMIAAGPYLNVQLDMASLASSIVGAVRDGGDRYGWGDSFKG